MATPTNSNLKSEKKRKTKQNKLISAYYEDTKQLYIGIMESLSGDTVMV